MNALKELRGLVGASPETWRVGVVIRTEPGRVLVRADGVSRWVQGRAALGESVLYKDGRVVAGASGGRVVRYVI